MSDESQKAAQDFNHRRPIFPPEVISKYRAVFCNPVGQEVLTDILWELGFFDAHIETNEERFGVNFSHLSLAKLGAWHGANAAGFVDALLKLPAYHKGEDNHA